MKFSIMENNINIIGISGKKGSGKNLLALLMQAILIEQQDPSFFKVPKTTNYLGKVTEMHDLLSFTLQYPNTVRGYRKFVGHNQWEEKSYAYKLKEIASILTGVPIPNFESQEFKEQTLPPEWNCYIMPRDGIMPALYPIDTDMEWMSQGKEYRERSLTYRALLQLLGTEALRNNIHPQVWINALFADYKPTRTKVSDGDSEEYKDILPKWIITDVRFPNEVKAIEDRGGVVIRVHRSFIKSEDNHPSETALDNHEFKYSLFNDGSIEAFKEMAEMILKELKII